MNNINNGETEICCYVFGERTNKLEKGQEPGEATETRNSGEVEILSAGMPIIESVAQSHKVEIKKDGVYRTINGKEIKAEISVEEAKRRLNEKKTEKEESIEEK